MRSRRVCKESVCAIPPRKHVETSNAGSVVVDPVGSHAFAVMLQARSPCTGAAKAWHPTRGQRKQPARRVRGATAHGVCLLQWEIGMTPRQTVDRLIRLFEERGDRHYGENVTERAHALQTAFFAQQSGEPAAIVAACLLHDYGHLLHNLGEDIADRGVDARHEELGARALADQFVPEVVEPIRLHVAAKRYLCWRQPSYHEGLSESSRLSLKLQGGPMSAAEGEAFEKHPHFEAALKLRRYDDMGKVPDLRTPSLEDFRPLLEGFVRRGDQPPA
jgi:phosphonate degradation associated HDIG domain protein